MVDIMASINIWVPVTAAVAVVFLSTFMLMRRRGKGGNARGKTKDNKKDRQPSPPADDKPKKQGKAIGSIKSLQKNLKNQGPTKSDSCTNDPHFVSQFKGLKGEVNAVAICPKGEKVAVASSDQTIKVFGSDFWERGAGVIASTKIVSDEPAALDFTCDGQQVVVVLNNERVFQFHHITKGTDGKPMGTTFVGTKMLHKGAVKSIVASKGPWILTIPDESETELKVWNYRGELLATHDTKQVKNFHTNWSPIDGRFFGVAAWSPGIKVMEIKCKMGAYQGVNHAMSLKSEKGCNAVTFSADHSRAVVAQKDGQFSLWRTDVRYEVNEDAKLLSTHTPDFVGDLPRGWTKLAMTYNGKVLIAVAVGDIYFFQLETFEELGRIPEAHQTVATMQVSMDDKYLLTGGPEGKPRVWRIPQ